MFGIFGLIVGGLGFTVSNVNQKYAEVKVKNSAKLKGHKYYTDSHGIMRDVNTNKSVSEYNIIPRPMGSKKMIWKVVDTTGTDINEDDLPAIKYFKNSKDAWDYIHNNYPPGDIRHTVGVEWI